jgi:hypothetical protein
VQDTSQTTFHLPNKLNQQQACLDAEKEERFVNFNMPANLAVARRLT